MNYFMSKILSLKLRDNIFQETETIIKQGNVARNKYINEALDFYNQLQKRRLMKQKLAKESSLVASNSLEVLEEFELLEDTIKND